MTEDLFPITKAYKDKCEKLEAENKQLLEALDAAPAPPFQFTKDVEYEREQWFKKYKEWDKQARDILANPR